MENLNRCIAHEIRNQISVCELYSQIIRKNLEKDGIKNESIENSLNCILKALKIMNNSLTDLKSLDNLQMKKCDLREILKDAINLSTVYICDKDIEISLSCEEDSQIYVDENKFLACIVNIIKNAVEAIEHKGEIRVSTHINDKVHIFISNNGEPIKDTEHLFDEGFTTKKTGNGLGLPICKEYLKEQNAELKLSKSTEKLTEFEIIIPIKNF